MVDGSQLSQQVILTGITLLMPYLLLPALELSTESAVVVIITVCVLSWLNGPNGPVSNCSTALLLCNCTVY